MSNTGRMKDMFKGGRSIATPGIHMNVAISAEYVKTTSAAGNPYEAIKIKVVNEDGDTFNKLCLRPAKGYPMMLKDKEGKELGMESEKEALYRAENQSLAWAGRLANLVNANIIEDNDDYETLARNFIKVIDSDPTMRFNIKLVLDKNDKYLELPRYPESAVEVFKADKETKLKITDKDNMGKKANAATDDLGMPSEAKDDLPF